MEDYFHSKKTNKLQVKTNKLQVKTNKLQVKTNLFFEEQFTKKCVIFANANTTGVVLRSFAMECYSIATFSLIIYLFSSLNEKYY
jgi:hypothetical protein